MNNPDLLKNIVQSLTIGIAIVDTDNWAIVLENAKFFQWFPPGDDADAPLTARVAGIDAERAQKRLDNNRSASFEIETRTGARTIPLSVDVRPLPQGDRSYAIVECHNISKQRETEYMLQSYSKIAEKNTREIQKEKDRVEKLLLNIMPRSVYEEMRDYGITTPQRFECASVMMLDFVGFTEMANTSDPGSLIAELNDIFTAFDRIVELFGCERIKTIGDAYLCVSGLPELSPEHPQNIARAALRIRRYLERRNAAHPQEWLCRIGINSGPVIGSIVGIQKYVYDVFGPSVNLAARMEALAEPMAITLCEDTHKLIKDEFVFTELGEVEIKGFGPKRVYSLVSELPKA